LIVSCHNLALASFMFPLHLQASQRCRWSGVAGWHKTYGFTLNPPEPEVDTGVSMQLSSSELSYNVLRCTSGPVRQARRYDCYEGLVERWWCIGALWVVRWRHLANLSFHSVGVAGVRMGLWLNSHWVMLYVQGGSTLLFTFGRFAYFDSL